VAPRLRAAPTAAADEHETEQEPNSNTKTEPAHKVACLEDAAATPQVPEAEAADSSNSSSNSNSSRSSSSSSSGESDDEEDDRKQKIKTECF